MIVKIFGPPGTGKTTALKNILTRELQYLQLRDICFISFSNAAVKEMCSRIHVRKGSGKAYYFRTLHGVCLSMAMNSSNGFSKLAERTFGKGFVDRCQLIFCRKFGIPFDPTDSSVELKGNKAFSRWSAIVGEYFPIYHDLCRCLDVLANEDYNLAEVIEKWLQYKRQEQIIDYNDILIYAYIKELVPNVQVLFVDEAQDFNRLEFEIIKGWLNNVNRAYFAADDDQCIYSHKNAKPDFYLDLPADREIILQQSWRLPKKVLTYALQIIKHVKRRKPKSILPLAIDGVVKDLGVKTIKDITLEAVRLSYKLKPASVFLLFRTNAMVREAEKVLLQIPYPFKRLKAEKIWEKELFKTWNIVVAIKKGELPKGHDLRFIKNRMKVELPNEKFKLLLGRDITPLLDPEKYESDGERIIEIVKRAKDFVDPSEINLYVDTIHSAKGREADVVILCDGITQTIVDALAQGDDSEFRVYYVGATRSKRVLMVVHLAEYTHFLRYIFQHT